MAFAQYIAAVSSSPIEYSNPLLIATSPSTPSFSSSSSSYSNCNNNTNNNYYNCYYSSLKLKSRHLSSLFSKPSKPSHSAKALPQEPETGLAVDTFTHFKHVLLPVTDRNPYLSEGTRQAAATTTALAKKYGADITIVVIDEKERGELAEHDKQLSSIRWHLSEGGFDEYKLLERLGEGKKPTAIIGEVADDLNLDLVIMSMEAIHSKYVDANLLAEFIPCPVLLLPL